MAERIFTFAPTATHGGSVGVPVALETLAMTPVVVEKVEIVIPDGHMGLTGLYLAMAGQQVIPEVVGMFIVGNNEKLTWDLTGFLDTGAWQAFGYNADTTYDHSWQLRFLCSSVSVPAPTAPPFIPVGA